MTNVKQQKSVMNYKTEGELVEDPVKDVENENEVANEKVDSFGNCNFGVVEN